MQNLITDIMHEDFEMPVSHTELEAIIAIAKDEYNEMPRFKKSTSAYKRKLNELIREYNDMRGMVLISLL